MKNYVYKYIIQYRGEIKINPYKIFTDLFLLLFSFSFTFFLKRGNLRFDEAYLKFLPLFILCWFLSGIFTSKFRDSEEGKIEPYSFSALYFTGLLALLIFGFELYNLSRFIIFGTISIYLLLEIFIVSGLFIPVFVSDKTQKKRYSYLLIISEFAILSGGFFTIHYLKLGTLILSSETYMYILLSIYFLWFFTSLFTHKFILDLREDFFKMLLPFIRSYFIILSIFSVFIFGFRIEGLSRLLVFGTIIIYAGAEIFILFSIFMFRYIQKSDIPEINFFDAPLLHEDTVISGIIDKEQKVGGKYSIRSKKFKSGLISEKLSEVYLKRFPEIFNYINRSVNLSSVDIVHSEVMDTGNPYNVNVLPENSLDMLINLYQLNGFRYLNNYLIQVNKTLKYGGIFISKFEPHERRYYYFRNKYPAFFARIFYFFDFIWKRVLPKTPVIKKLYFLISRGRRRVFSMAQGLGRLYYCGFEVLSLENFDNYVWFVVKKIKEPVKDTASSYGFFFKQKRVGKNGGFIYTYKVRTMHPFSEYIHEYIYDRNKLDDKGKIKDDFRISSWGKIFRKLWIDELPMIYNWLRRDLKLIGVRPLSETFFDTYPEDLKKLRTENKPGLIPPYYADLPGSIEEVWKSERKYLKRYKKKPLRTDLKYFCKAFINIVFKGAKSS